MRMDDIVYLRHGRQGRFLRLAEVSAMEAEQNYSVAWLADCSRHMLRRTILIARSSAVRHIGPAFRHPRVATLRPAGSKKRPSL